MIIIKILHVISGNDNGGGGNHVLNICKSNIEDMKCQIACIGGGPLYNKAKELGISTDCMSLKNMIGGGLVEVIQNNKIDIVNFHGAKAFLIHGIIKNKLKIKTVATIHSDYRKDFLNNKFKYYFFTPLSIKGLKSFDNYICVSNFLKELTDKDNFKGNKFIVSNGIDFNDFCNNEEDEIDRESLNIEKEDFVFAMIARMHPIKNHKNLIDAFDKLSKETNNIKLILLGDGEERNKIEKQIENLSMQEKIMVLGFKENVKDYIKISDITVLTSFSEGGAPPIAILESGALKVPIIASDVCDIPYLINSSNGYLVNPNSIEDIYKKMKESYVNKNRLKELGDKLYRDILDKYSMDSFWKSYYKHYESIIMNK